LVWTGGHFVFRFIKGGMNLIDLLGILPYFVSLSLDLVTTTARFERCCYQCSGSGSESGSGSTGSTYFLAFRIRIRIH
jgi:hypothetical protein